MKTSLSGIALVAACGLLTCDVFARNYKPAFLIKNASPLLTKRKYYFSYYNYDRMIKFGSDDNEKKTHFQTFMTSAGFGPSTTVFKTLAAKEIETVGGFLTMDVKLFSKENLNKDGSQRLSTGDILKLQNLRMWAYCR